MSTITACIDTLPLLEKRKLLGILNLTQPKDKQIKPSDIAKMDDEAVNTALGALDGKCGQKGERTAGAALRNNEIAAIKEIQQGLDKLGLYDKSIDGVISKGGATETALGKLGVQVERDDKGAIKDVGALKKAFDTALGENVNRVKALQEGLQVCDKSIKVDGDLGPKTRADALKALDVQEAKLYKDGKGTIDPAKKTEIDAARADLTDGNGLISDKTVGTVVAAAKDAGACLAEAKAAAEPARKVIADKGEGSGKPDKPAKKPARAQRAAADREEDADTPTRRTRGGGRQTTEGGDLQTTGTGRFRSNDAPDHIHSEHTGSKPARRGNTARHDQFQKITEAAVGHEKFDAVKRMAAQNRRQGFNGGAIMTIDGYVFPSDVREVETPLGPRYYGKGAVRADGGDGSGGGVGGSGGGGRGAAK